MTPKATNRRLGVNVCQADLGDTETALAIRSSTEARSVAGYRERHRTCGKTVSGNEVLRYSTALLLTCRHIHQEAALLPFEGNTFDFTYSIVLRTFLKKTLRIQQRAIKSLCWPPQSYALEFVGLRNLTGLRSLTVLRSLSFSGRSDPARALELDKERLRNELRLLKGFKWERVTICITEGRYTHTGNGSKVVERVNPDFFNDCCGQLEAELLA